MFVVSLLFVALFTQAFAQSDNSVDDDGEMGNAVFAVMEQQFASNYPIPYKIIEYLRKMLGISKEDLTQLSMGIIELLTNLNTSVKDISQSVRTIISKRRSTRNSRNVNTILTRNQQYHDRH